MAKASWFRIDAASGTPTIYIYDEIGLFGVTASSFQRELKALGNLKGKSLNVRINSPGGDVFGGWTIMSLLKETGAKITVYVDGVAASMASAIAMMGDTTIMAEGAMMMIHNPAGFKAGDSEDMRNMATLLDSIKEGMVSAYSKKSGQGREAIAKIMDDETWFTAEDAVREGFADEVGEVVKAQAFDLSRYSSNPPLPEAEHKESDMDKNEVAAMIADANKPLLDAIAKLAPAAKVEPVAVAVKSEADIRKDLKAESAAYTAEVRDVCALAGLPELADGYVAKDTPLAEVRVDLKAKKAEAAAALKNPNLRIRNRDGKTPDTDASLKDGEEDISDLIPKARSHASIWASFHGKTAVN